MESRAVLETKSLVEQIDKLLDDVKALIGLKRDFEAFIIISIGIEVLGSFYDSENIEDFGQSENRFKNCLKNDFKSKWYTSNAEKTFKNLRGPLVHQYRCGPEILITSVCKNNAVKGQHLKTVDGQTLFVLEQFFEDFQDAFKRSKNNLNKQNNGLNKEKPNKDHEEIIEHTTPMGKFSTSGSTSTTLTIVKEKKAKKSK
jgi:hypothetical protein